MDQAFQYDVALSFSGHDRQLAERLAHVLSARGVRVFYDAFETEHLWGEDLYVWLADVYSKKARYCVMFLSQHYSSSLWTSHERRFAQARAFREHSAYILPLKLDDTEIPGIPETTAYVDLRDTTIEEVAQLLVAKLELSSRATDPVPSWRRTLAAYAERSCAHVGKDSGVQFYVPLRYESLNAHGIADQAIRQWIPLENDPLRVILGDYGTGKTTLCLHLLKDTCEELVRDHASDLIPIHVPLRDSSRFFRMADPVKSLFEYAGLPGRLGVAKTYLVMLDGYDELLDANDRSSFHAVVRTLLTTQNVKILLTARSHYFRTHSEALSRVATETRRGTSLEAVRDETDWLAKRTLNLLELEPEDIRAYLSLRFAGDASAYFEKLIRIYDLADLAKRPILLSLIVRLLPEIDEREVITQDYLYETTVNSWLNREAWRGLNTTTIIRFMEGLAQTMFLQEVFDLHYSDLSQEIRDGFQADILSRMDVEYFDNLVRTSGFLHRDADGRFSFMHRSFLEYFFGRVLNQRITEDRLILLATDDLGGRSFFDFSRTWMDAEQLEKEKQEAIASVNSHLGKTFDRAYSLSDGIIELLVSALMKKHGGHVVTERIYQFATKRKTFREEQRALERHAARIRGYGDVDEDDGGEKLTTAFQRVMMIGGQGRIYYTLENYSFSLFVNSHDSRVPWALALGYFESWKHT